MRLNQFEGALKAFAESVSIDDSQGEAWGNMASCYMHLKKMK
jgi:Tfp pilus assembly protein PilF